MFQNSTQNSELNVPEDETVMWYFKFATTVVRNSIHYMWEPSVHEKKKTLFQCEKILISRLK